MASGSNNHQPNISIWSSGLTNVKLNTTTTTSAIYRDWGQFSCELKLCAAGSKTTDPCLSQMLPVPLEVLWRTNSFLRGFMRPHAEGQKEPGFTQSLRDKYAQLSKGRGSSSIPPLPMYCCCSTWPSGHKHATGWHTSSAQACLASLCGCSPLRGTHV